MHEQKIKYVLNIFVRSRKTASISLITAKSIRETQA